MKYHTHAAKGCQPWYLHWLLLMLFMFGQAVAAAAEDHRSPAAGAGSAGPSAPTIQFSPTTYDSWRREYTSVTA